MRSANLSVLLLAISGLVMLPGCIVQDIHDQIALSNDQLNSINESFAKVERANELLAELDEKLARLDAINANLDEVDATLSTVETDLKAVSESLASLRKTINNIDSTIPFLKISGDDDAAKDQLDQSGNTSVQSNEASPEDAPPRGGS